MQKQNEGIVDRARLVELAHRKFLARGGAHGRDLDDWLEAEAELRREAAAGHASEYEPTRATEREAERHARDAKEGHHAAGVHGRSKVTDSASRGKNARS